MITAAQGYTLMILPLQTLLVQCYIDCAVLWVYYPLKAITSTAHAVGTRLVPGFG